MDIVLNNYLLFWTCIVGLCLGSFYNVVILRTLSNESIVFPPSKCPKCGSRLKPWHNIPVLSYIFLRGKCAFCKEKISIQYPIIELLTMTLFACSFLKFGISLKTLFAMVLCSCLIIMTMTDIKEKLVDCNIAIGLGVVGLAYNHNLDSLFGLIVGALVIEFISRIGKMITGKPVMGEADAYISGALGACFGLSNLWILLVYTLAASMIFVIPMFLYNELQKNNKTICILFVLFILSALVYLKAFQSMYLYALLVILAIILCVVLIKSLRKNPTPLSLPFFPAFALGALFYLFYHM